MTTLQQGYKNQSANTIQGVSRL